LSALGLLTQDDWAPAWHRRVAEDAFGLVRVDVPAAVHRGEAVAHAPALPRLLWTECCLGLPHTFCIGALRTAHLIQTTAARSRTYRRTGSARIYRRHRADATSPVLRTDIPTWPV